MVNRPSVGPVGLAVAVYFFFAVVCTAVQTPLHVAIARSAARKICDDTDDEISEAGAAEVAGGVRAYSKNEEVITTRVDHCPYIGLVDCLNKFVTEEGWLTLFRAWWFIHSACRKLLTRYMRTTNIIESFRNFLIPGIGARAIAHVIL
ncbi:hypothetical protein L218DRAFT_261791 [Marasmius fiardii PR-910]|nr:hypothetical protein L218DRAFT_261791 [Marasmius fiardii PR-910]